MSMDPNANDFRIAGSKPPISAMPSPKYPPIVRLHPAEVRRGDGTGIVYGSPYAILGREWITQAGLDWWAGHTGSLTVKLLNPATGNWTNYTGIGRIVSYEPDPDYQFVNFVFRIDNLRAA
ncbi:hypothetical protein Rctr71_083 [Virus Rctr71]|nr:hypothetical protein Rctr71_083 [Virus Rctr71]